MIGKRVVSLMRVGTIPILQKKVPPHNDSSDEEPFTRLMNNVGPNQRPIDFGLLARRIYVPGLATRKEFPIGKHETHAGLQGDEFRVG